MPKFKVVRASRPFAGVEPGGTVELDDEDLIAKAVAAGSIEPVPEAPKKSAKADPEDTDG